MAYGTIKVDNITFDNGGVDKLITVSGLFYSTSGALTVTGAISGGSVTAPTATFTTLTGTTTAGTTATFTSGSFTSLTSVTTNVTSGIFALGTAAAPSITISGDLNTGIYSPGADQLAIVTNGTQRLLADSAGGVTVPTRFIIGQVNNVGGLSETTRTTSGIFNTSRLLDGGTNPYLQTGAEAGIVYFNADGSSAPATVFRVGGAEKVRIDSSGRLGIGTIPDTILHTAVSQAGSAAINIFKAQATNTTDNVITRLDLSAEPALGTASVVRLSAITGNAADSSNMAFNVRNGGVSIEALRISSVGNVGVGTTPTTKLDVAGSGDSELRLRAFSDPSLIFSETTANKNWRIKPSAGDFCFQYSATAYNSGYSSLAVLTSSGRLVIGNTGDLTSNANRLSIEGSRCIDAKGTGGATSPLATFWNNATTGDNIFLSLKTETSDTSRGSITYNRAGGVVAYNITSDYRTKTLLGAVENPGETIDAFKVYRGVMNGATVERPMLVAHEAKEVAPYCVTGQKDAEDDNGDPIYQQMDHQVLVPLLIAEIQQLRARVAALEAA